MAKSVATLKFANAKAWAAAIKKHGDRVVQRAAYAMHKSAQLTMTEIKQQHVPVRDGTLKSSGFVDIPTITSEGAVSVIMGFGGMAADYAFSVHENPRSGKTGGRSPSGGYYYDWADTGHWHYLSEPVAALRPRLAKQIAMIMKTGGQK